MRYVFDNDLHIHSTLSSCSSDPAESTERILAYGVANHLKTLCLTDHFWDDAVPGASGWYAPQNLAAYKSGSAAAAGGRDKIPVRLRD